MSLRTWSALGCAAVVVVVGSASVARQATSRGSEPEARFLAENDRAMSRMMDGMKSPSTGDVDRDFVAMMAPHHRGAVDMAIAELKYGRNLALRRLAQEIIVTQQQEIAVMYHAIGSPLPPGYSSAPASRGAASPSAPSPSNEER